MIYILILLALIARILLTPLPAFGTDMGCWLSWANHMLNVGPANFYSTIWSDYLPSYLYILWFIAFLHYKVLFFIPYEMLLKMPAVLADLGIGWLIYMIVHRTTKNLSMGLIASALYMFNPFTYFNSSVWGQVDAVYAFSLLLSVYLNLSGNPSDKWRKWCSWTILAFSFLLKPQTLFFLPPLVILRVRKYGLKATIKLLGVFILTTFFLSLPFFLHNPIFGLPTLILKSAGTYPYTSIFAMNFWGVFGTWEMDSQKVLFLTKQRWGTLMLVAGLTLSWLAVIREKSVSTKSSEIIMYLSCALTAFSFFILPTRVHERWLFAFFPFFLIVCALINDIKLWLCFVTISLLHVLNLYYVYTYYNPNFLKLVWLTNLVETKFGTLSFLSTFVYGYLVYYSLRFHFKTGVQKLLSTASSNN